MHNTTGDSHKLHPYQRLLDNPWLLLVLGLVVPILSYTLWGIFELLSLRPATLP
jgi:thiol:disulfide interchange protein